MMISPVKVWRNQKRIRSLLGQTGKIVSWTVVYVPPEGFIDQAPYVVALVELSTGTRHMAQVVDYRPEHLRVDQPVRTMLRRTRDAGTEGVIPYGIKFIPF